MSFWRSEVRSKGFFLGGNVDDWNGESEEMITFFVKVEAGWYQKVYNRWNSSFLAIARIIVPE